MLGSYYSNKWFSGSPYLTQVDSEVNFHWTGDLIPGVARDYVSITWEGYLAPVYSESYTFYVEANDGVRVIVNGQTVIDSLVDSATDLDTHLITSKTPLPLQAGALVPITVQYYQNTGIGTVALYWQSAS